MYNNVETEETKPHSDRYKILRFIEHGYPSLPVGAPELNGPSQEPITRSVQLP